MPQNEHVAEERVVRLSRLTLFEITKCASTEFICEGRLEELAFTIYAELKSGHVFIALEPSRLPSSLPIMVGNVIEAADVCGRINLAKALAEPSCGSVDIAHVAIDQWAEIRFAHISPKNEKQQPAGLELETIRTNNLVPTAKTT